MYQQGECLIKPLLQSLSHQHNKVRVAVLKVSVILILPQYALVKEEINR